MLVEENEILKGERYWIEKVKSNLLDISVLEEYGNWLSRFDSDRAIFVEEFKNNLLNQLNKDFLLERNYIEEWKEVIGFNLAYQMKKHNCFFQRNEILSFIRPALRMEKSSIENTDIGESKIGGSPDLPKEFPWPLGEDCNVFFNESTEDEKRLAGFIAQINLKEISGFKTHNNLPEKGLLSFFCFQDIENDNPDKIGIRCFYFQDLEGFEKKVSPKELTDGNAEMKVSKMEFIETYDFPESYDSPWSAEIELKTEGLEDFFDYYRNKNFENILGYGRGTTGSDPTENREYQHLIMLENSAECRLHIQIPIKDLKVMDFDKIKLCWVDFD